MSDEFRKLREQIATLQAELKTLREKRTLELSAEPIDLPALQLRGRVQ
jgi:hypothetical protein